MQIKKQEGVGGMYRKSKELREAEADLKRNGYTCVEVTGSHHKYVNRYTGEHISLPLHLNKMVKRREWKTHGIV